MARTLTDTGIRKIGKQFIDSADHAAYTLDGTAQTIPLFRKTVSGNEIRIYIYFDEEVTGDIANVELIDTDGDTVAASDDKVFIKTPGKGLYIAFKYNITEVEAEEANGIV